MPSSQSAISTATASDKSGFSAAAGALVDRFRAQRPLRTGSLLISVFGDAIVPHGGTVWLGSLIRALAGFGISQRLVRTSVYRLVQDDWLRTEQVGRRSYYSLTGDGRQQYLAASERVYRQPRRDWDGNWCLVLNRGAAGAPRDHIDAELSSLGFAGFGRQLFAHPCPDRPSLLRQTAKAAARGDTLIFDARLAAGSDEGLRNQVAESWSLNALSERYESFLIQFRSIYQRLRRDGEAEPEVAFRVRTLLIHEYRKIVLRDPMLPPDLLPEGWSGLAAWQLCRNLYRGLMASTERYICEQMENVDGPLPPAERGFFQRFGGLADVDGTTEAVQPTDR